MADQIRLSDDTKREFLIVEKSNGEVKMYPLATTEILINGTACANQEDIVVFKNSYTGEEEQLTYSELAYFKSHDQLKTALLYVIAGEGSFSFPSS